MIEQIDRNVDWYIMDPLDVLTFKEACIYIGGVDKNRMNRLKIPSTYPVLLYDLGQWKWGELPSKYGGNYTSRSNSKRVWYRMDLDKWLEETAPTSKIFNTFLRSRI